MADRIDKQLEELQGMSVPELRKRHFDLIGRWPHSSHRQHLVRELAWHIQAKEYGGLPQDVRSTRLPSRGIPPSGVA